jgi:glycosyltransferase involved in cell wall biosynthesis
MRLLQVVPFPQRRGAEVFASDLNNWLEGKGHQVYTLYLYHYLQADALRPHSPHTSALAPYRSRLEKIPGFNPRLLWFLGHTVALFRPDIVQVNGGRALKYGALAKTLLRKDFALVYRSIGSPRFWEKGFVGKHLAQSATNKADAVVAVSDATLAEFGPSSSAQIRRRIHRGTELQALRRADPIERESLQTPSDAKVLIYVGSLSFEKCPLRTISVFHQLLSEGYHAYLWILGDGPQLEECRQRAAELQLTERIRFLGTVPEVGPYLKAADIHLLTSDTEGLPGCLVESAAVGVPCVAADVGGVQEIVLDGETGFVVTHNDIDSYVRQARQLLDDPQLCSRFSRRAVEWAENFSMEAIGPQYLDLYRDLLLGKERLR